MLHTTELDNPTLYLTQCHQVIFFQSPKPIMSNLDIANESIIKYVFPNFVLPGFRLKPTLIVLQHDCKSLLLARS